MIRRIAFFAFGAALAVACSLNPQPLPPGSMAADPDASAEDGGARSDATVGPGYDAGMGADAEADAPREAAPPGDAASDASTDADADDGALDAQGD